MLSVEWDMNDALAVRYEEGIERGREEGMERGRGYAVVNLLNYGMTPEDISRALNMPLDAVLSCRTTGTITAGK